MTDWQSSLMQQVAEPILFDVADRFGLSGTNLQPVFRPSRAFPCAATAPTGSGTLPRLSGKLVGRGPQEGVDRPAVSELVALLLRREPQQRLEAHLDGLVTRGVAAEQIYLRLLQPAARRLGELWLEDSCTFVDVTLATAVLQRGMRHLGPRFHQHARPARGMRSVVLGTLEGDQHTFGLAMAAEFFRRSGWTVFSIASGDGDEIARRLRGERNAVVGLSASRADQLPELSSVIQRLRQRGPTQLAGVLVGGPLFVTRPELARETGADAVGLDARQALAEAEALAAEGDDE